MGTNNIHAVNSTQPSVLSGAAQQQSGATSPPPITPPPMLLPGEVIKSSGKYSSQGGLAKIPGKNFVKEEVVIRNTDSGKGNHVLKPFGLLAMLDGGPVIMETSKRSLNILFLSDLSYGNQG